MRKAYTASALLVVIGFAAILAVHLSNQEKKTELYTSGVMMTQEDREFMSFITKHGRSYGTKEEF